MPWYMIGEKYFKFPLMFVFKPPIALAAFKLGRTQNSLYPVDDDILRTKTLEEVKQYVETGQFQAYPEAANPEASPARRRSI